MKTKDIVSPVVFQVVVLVILKLTGVNGKRKSQMKMVLGGIEDFSKETSHLWKYPAVSRHTDFVCTV